MDIFEELEQLESTRDYACARLAFSISHKLGVILDQKGWSMARLARQMGVSRSYVQQVMTARQNVTLKKLAEICFALEVDPLQLFAEEMKSKTSESGEPAALPMELEALKTRYLNKEPFLFGATPKAVSKDFSVSPFSGGSDTDAMKQLLKTYGKADAA